MFAACLCLLSVSMWLCGGWSWVGVVGVDGVWGWLWGVWGVVEVGVRVFVTVKLVVVGC